ncbi:hypothetical protein BCR39DRAFT_181683 [Naematelia encephala]|uniref:Uncharacterized protein n=1 Tax=Naematelia encephala TaxID=71784 RepID=A0A1Y2B4G5_9TREE|nr:hypothetical protein BCR39DRAFT_181683 [Naematelia encephala]
MRFRFLLFFTRFSSGPSFFPSFLPSFPPCSLSSSNLLYISRRPPLLLTLSSHPYCCFCQLSESATHSVYLVACSVLLLKKTCPKKTRVPGCS